MIITFAGFMLFCAAAPTVASLFEKGTKNLDAQAKTKKLARKMKKHGMEDAPVARIHIIAKTPQQTSVLARFMAGQLVTTEEWNRVFPQLIANGFEAADFSPADESGNPDPTGKCILRQA